MSSSESPELEVPAALAGMRLDRAVSFLTGLTRAGAARLVEEGGARLDGAVVHERARRLREGERLFLEASLAARPEEEARLEPSTAVPFTVVYEDEELLVVEKPAGVVVHPGAGNRAGTLAAGLLAAYPELARLPAEGVGEADRPGIVHRLDKETSGLLVVARSPAAHASLSAQLQRRTMSRRYRAILVGHLESDRGIVDAPIGRSEGDPTKRAVIATGREARTSYETRARFSQPLQASEVELTLETGRTHQIRVHMAAIGHPVLGDRRYGGRRGALSVGRPMLHAAELRLTHPASGQEMTFSSPLPRDFAQALAALS